LSDKNETALPANTLFARLPVVEALARLLVMADPTLTRPLLLWLR
jgi:hypothetical protein